MLNDGASGPLGRCKSEIRRALGRDFEAQRPGPRDGAATPSSVGHSGYQLKRWSNSKPGFRLGDEVPVRHRLEIIVPGGRVVRLQQSHPPSQF